MDHIEDCDGNGSVECWCCDGEGGYHNCGEDCCCCADAERNVHCEVCDGAGVIICPACAEQNDPTLTIAPGEGEG